MKQLWGWLEVEKFDKMPNIGISVPPKMQGQDLFDLIMGPIEHYMVLETGSHDCQDLDLTNAT